MLSKVQAKKQVRSFFAFPRSNRSLASLAICLGVALLNMACAGGTGTSSSAPGGGGQGTGLNSASGLTISPSLATVTAGDTLQFNATLNNSSTTAVNWSASAGSMSSNGLFTAPSVSMPSFVTVAAISANDGTEKAIASLTVIPQNANAPTNLVNTENRYCGKGNIPNFSGEMDGPAQLPTSCYYTGIDGTPSLGKVWSGTDPNALYAQAQCGDVIELTAGASISENPNFPHKNCDDQHYLTIRTSTSDSQLPPEGTRISPCFFGVASLPGRPPFPSCPAGGAKSLGFKIVPPLNATPVFGDHIRFIGIEFAKNPGKIWYGLDLTGSDHIIFDRVWIHGNPNEEVNRGVRIVDTQYVAVINSYLNEFHCIEVCTDGHAIAGGSDKQSGVYHGAYKIYGNFLEGSAESILFGGAPSVDTSCDIDIEDNFLFKPLSWDPADPSYDGGTDGRPYITKNHFELKNACRVLFRGNRLMNVWAGFSQKGASILLTAASQADQCPNCEVHDVTVAYNYISNAEQAVQIGNSGEGKNYYAFAGKNYSVHDLIADGLDFPTAYDPGTLFKMEMDTGPTAPINDILSNVAINHVTLVEQAATTGGFLNMSGPTPAAEFGIVFKNSVLYGGKYGVFSSGGTGNCANGPAVSPIDKFNACWTAPYVFTNNLILGGNSIPYDVWPSGNITDVTSQSATYVNLNGGVFGDYHLTSNSPGKNGADDGSDIGANVDMILQEIAGIH